MRFGKDLVILTLNFDFFTKCRLINTSTYFSYIKYIINTKHSQQTKHIQSYSTAIVILMIVLLGFTSRLGANWCTGINISSLFQFISYTHIQHSCSRCSRSGRRLSGYICTFLVALLVLYREDKSTNITVIYTVLTNILSQY